LTLVGLVATVLVLLTQGERPSARETADGDTVVSAEVVSGEPTIDPLADRSTSRPRLERPLPDPASSVHDLVVGYPEDILPVPPGSQIEGSSVSPAPGSLHVSLQASLPLSSRALLRYFRVELGDNGFAQQSVLRADTASAAAFARGRESVVVTVAAEERGRTTYTVFGTLRLR
jgi:hypothetical protein